jgi:hypothetical protein
MIIPTRRSCGLAFDEDTGPAPPIPSQPMEEDKEEEDVGVPFGEDDGVSELLKEAEKRWRFDERYKMANHSNEEVLGA